MYNKLFTKILDSSIWLEKDYTRLVWITMLATMDEDGFCQYASVGNLAHRAVVSREKAEDAVKILESPDANSSDPEHEGRRIERVPGGWMVLNSKKYRDLATREKAKEQNRERVRKHRASRKATVFEKIYQQNGLCDCCEKVLEKPHNLYVVEDHNHETGESRGVICQSCNKIVGQLENGKTVLSEKKEICEEYIKRYSTVIPCNSPVTPSEAFANTQSKTEPKKKNGAFNSLEAAMGYCHTFDVVGEKNIHLIQEAVDIQLTKFPSENAQSVAQFFIDQRMEFEKTPGVSFSWTPVSFITSGVFNTPSSWTNGKAKK